MHKVTMTLFAITLYGQCCQCHVVRQRVVSVIHSCCSTCSLCSETTNTNLIPCLLIAVPGTSILLHTTNTVCHTTWQHVLG